MTNFLSDVGLITIFSIGILTIKLLYDYFFNEQFQANRASDELKGEQTIIIPGNTNDEAVKKPKSA